MHRSTAKRMYTAAEGGRSIFDTAFSTVTAYGTVIRPLQIRTRPLLDAGSTAQAYGKIAMPDAPAIGVLLEAVHTSPMAAEQELVPVRAYRRVHAHPDALKRSLYSGKLTDACMRTQMRRR